MKTVECTIALVVLIIISTDAANLPSYISKCSLKDPKLWECLAKSANEAIPKLAKGDKYYDIPPMCPLTISSSIVFKNDKDLKFVLHNPQIYGLENTVVSTMNFDGNLFRSVYINPQITILGKYEILGTLLNQSIFGNGPLNITLDKGILKYNVTLPTKILFEEAFFDIKRPTFTYETVETKYCFENLYGGSKFLGAQMNSLINKNWEAVGKTLEPILTKMFKDIFTSVMNAIFKNVPVNEIFKA